MSPCYSSSHADFSTAVLFSSANHPSDPPGLQKCQRRHIDRCCDFTHSKAATAGFRMLEPLAFRKPRTGRW